MKTSKFRGFYLLPLIFIAGIPTLSGCSSSTCSEGGGQLSAAWTGFPVVEGGEVCACGKYAACDEYINIVHKAGNPLETVDKYSEKLKSGGWKVEPLGTSRMSLWATKADVKVDLFFKECGKSLIKLGTWSNCTEIGVTRKK